MYDLEALRRKIRKEGISETIKYLSSPTLPNNIKNDLTNFSVFVGGYLNVTLLYTLM